MDSTTDYTAHKAYAAALVAVVLYVLSGLTTGEWAGVENIAPALAIIIAPLVVWAVPNKQA
jgi:hypothetical protein